MNTDNLQNNQNTRDYDKDPIVIEDYNPRMTYISINSVFFLGLLIIFFNPFDIPWDRMIGGLVGLLIIYYPIHKEYKKIIKKFIILTEQYILIHDKNGKEIYKASLTDIHSVQKTYQTYYTKKQSIQSFSGIKKTFAYLFYIILLPLRVLDLIRILYKKILLIIKFKTSANLSLFDSILFISNTEIVNVLIADEQIYKDVNEYIIAKFSKPIKQLNINLMFFYIDEIK